MAEYRKFHCPYGDDFEGGDECDRCEQYELCMETPTANVIEVPEGATNGDIIKAAFNCMVIDITNGKVYVEKIYFPFDLDWWNAPYESEASK